MKILFILEYYYPHIGGVETLFKSLTEKLVENGHEITVLTNRFDQTLPKTEDINGVHIKRLSFQNRYAFTFFAVFQAVRLAGRYDLIQTTSYNAALSAYIAGKLRRKKTVITFHEVWGKLWKDLPWMSPLSKKLHSLFEWFILKMNFDHFVAVSDFTKDAVISHGVEGQKVSRIYNGLDYNEIKKPNNLLDYSKKTFLYFGRAGVSKGLDILVDAVYLLKDHTFNFILVLPSKSDPLVKKVLSLVEEKGLDEIVHYQTSLSYEDLKRTISSVYAVIIPSYSEGFCFAAAETNALDTPIISSGRGALKEVVRGKYREFENMSPTSLAETIIAAAEGNWLYKKERKFDLEESVRNYIDLYERIYNDN